MRNINCLVVSGLALVAVFAINLVVQDFVFMVVSLSIALAAVAVASAAVEHYADSLR